MQSQIPVAIPSIEQDGYHNEIAWWPVSSWAIGKHHMTVEPYILNSLDLEELNAQRSHALNSQVSYDDLIGTEAL